MFDIYQLSTGVKECKKAPEGVTARIGELAVKSEAAVRESARTIKFAEAVMAFKKLKEEEEPRQQMRAMLQKRIGPRDVSQRKKKNLARGDQSTDERSCGRWYRSLVTR